MEKFNSENLISSLFASGFEKVDSTLYTLVLGKISLEQRKNTQFEFVDENFTEQFNECVCFDGIAYKLKEGLPFESDTKMFKDEKYTLKQFFSAGVVNKKLIEYFKHFDFRDVIIHKINLIGIARINKLSSLFSDKEKDIINLMFGIEEMQREDDKNSTATYDRIYNQESTDIDNIIKTLSMRRKKLH